MEITCKSCGFVNPESSHYCTMCGDPFLAEVKERTFANARAPSKKEGESGDVDLEAVLESGSEERDKASPEEPRSPAGDEDELDSLLSDFDGTFPPVKPRGR